MYYAITSFLVVLTFFEDGIEADYTVINLPNGKIRGHLLNSVHNVPYYAFQDIPYAAPPVGSRRFQLPEDPQNWTDILDVTQNKVVCYQRAVKYKDLNMDEDCLYINVYTPENPRKTKRVPVLVWIHGGGFTSGSGALEYFGPKFMIDSSLIIVTFNYRLGPFGFLTTNDDEIPANLGLKDQQKALEWVHDNIGFFGGNNGHVTLAGEGAGAMAIGLHLLGPWIDGKVLFHAAIMQSGSLLYSSRSNKAREAAFKVGEALSCSFYGNDSSRLLKLLQSAFSPDILAASTIDTNWPIIENDGAFKYHPYDSLLDGNFKKVPILIGFTSEEWLAEIQNPDIKELAANFDKDPSNLFGPQFNLSRENRTIAGNLLKEIYTNGTFLDNIGAYIRFISDNNMTTPIINQAVLHSKYANVYLYEFAYKGELGMQMKIPYVPGTERVAHAEDLKYIWNDETNSQLSQFPAEDYLAYNRYIKLWLSFMHYYNPTTLKDPLIGNITWPKVDPKRPDNIRYMNMNSTYQVRENPRYYQAVRKVFDQFVTPNDII